MKAQSLLKFLVVSVLAAGSWAQAGNITCQTNGAQNAKLQLGVYFGQGPSGSDLTVMTDSSGKKQFVSGYSEVKVGSATQYKTTLVNFGNNQKPAGQVTITKKHSGASEGLLQLKSEKGMITYELSCQETAPTLADNDPDHDPQPGCCHRID